MFHCFSLYNFLLCLRRDRWGDVADSLAQSPIVGKFLDNLKSQTESRPNMTRFSYQCAVSKCTLFLKSIIYQHFTFLSGSFSINWSDCRTPKQCLSGENDEMILGYMDYFTLRSIHKPNHFTGDACQNLGCLQGLFTSTAAPGLRGYTGLFWSFLWTHEHLKVFWKCTMRSFIPQNCSIRRIKSSTSLHNFSQSWTTLTFNQWFTAGVTGVESVHCGTCAVSADL